jgi:hypothetical protein
MFIYKRNSDNVLTFHQNPKVPSSFSTFTQEQKKWGFFVVVVLFFSFEDCLVFVLFSSAKAPASH